MASDVEMLENALKRVSKLVTNVYTEFVSILSRHMGNNGPRTVAALS